MFNIYIHFSVSHFGFAEMINVMNVFSLLQKNTTEHNRLLVKQIEYRIRNEYLTKLTDNLDTTRLIVTYNSDKMNALTEVSYFS